MGKTATLEQRHRALVDACIQRRHQLQWSRRHLAREAGLSVNAVRGFEKGQRMTRTATVNKILLAMKTTRTEMLARPPVTDARAIGLNDEDFELARQFHDSTTAMRVHLTRVFSLDPAIVDRLMQIVALVQHDPRRLDILLEFAKTYQSKASTEQRADEPTPALKSKA